MDYETWKNWLLDNGLAALNRIWPFALLLLVGIVVIRIVLKITSKALKKSKVDKAAHGMIRSLVKTVLVIVLGLMCASALGIDVSSILALASVITLAVSLALQDLLSNLVGGFTLLYTDPFSDGDYVEIGGECGTVKEIGMTYTKLLTPDNKLIQIPNSSVVSSEIINYTVTGKRRVDVKASASYDCPVDDVLAALREAANVEYILEEEGINALLTEYGDHEIIYSVRVWTATEHYWDVYHKVNYNVKKIFDQRGVYMSYPNLNIHLEKTLQEKLDQNQQKNAR